MFEDLRYQYHGIRFIGYVQRFNDSRKSGDMKTAIRFGAKAISVGEKLLDLESKLVHPMKVSVESPLLQVKTAYEFLQASERIRKIADKLGMGEIALDDIRRSFSQDS